MAHKAKQITGEAAPVKKPKPTAQKAASTTPSQEPEDSTADEPAYPHSLNEDLNELLEKNPRRFFGGCGG